MPAVRSCWGRITATTTIFLPWLPRRRTALFLSELFIDGFDTLTAQMLWLTERMLKHTDITVTLSYDESALAFIPRRDAHWKGLTQAAAAANVRMRRRA